MDDARGRALAELNGFRIIGTLGWLVRAKQAGLVPALRPLCERLRLAGWHIDERLLTSVLKAVGEAGTEVGQQ